MPEQSRAEKVRLGRKKGRSRFRYHEQQVSFLSLSTQQESFELDAAALRNQVVPFAALFLRHEELLSALKRGMLRTRPSSMDHAFRCPKMMPPQKT